MVERLTLVYTKSTQSMRLFTFLIPLAAFIFLTSVGLTAQVKYSNDFLNIGVGARAHGMSNAQVASVSDVTSGFWNPAGLTQLDAPFQVGGMHAEWFAGIAKYDFIGIAKPLDEEKDAAFGLSFIRLGIDGIPNTLRLYEADGSVNYDNVTEFSAADYGILLSYARSINIKEKKLFIGGNAKIIRRVIGSFANSWGFGLDIGAQYHHKNWKFGLVARDITTTFNSWNFSLTEEEKIVFEETGNDIPESTVEVTLPRFSFGTAYSKRVGEKVSLLGALDFDITTDGQRNVLISSKGLNVDPRFGLEVGYNDFIYLRGGLGNFQRALDDLDPDVKILKMQPNFGIGLKLGRFQIDYALTDIGDVSEVLYSNIFSLVLNFKQQSRG